MPIANIDSKQKITCGKTTKIHHGLEQKHFYHRRYLVMKLYRVGNLTEGGEPR
jgi:hypothetical protein